MNVSVLTTWLWNGRRALLGWTLGVVLVGGGYAAFWPTLDNPELQQLLENYPQAILEAIGYTEISTPQGYLNATIYGLVVAVLLLVFAVMTGTRLIAGDEEAGTLDLVQAHPVSRPSLALQRFAAFTVAVVVIAAVFWVVMVAIAGPAQFRDISPALLAAAHVHLALFTVMFGSITFAIGAATGRRGPALAAGAAIGVIAYAAAGLLPQVDGLEWTQDYSAFTWLNGSEPLKNGIDAGHALLMLGLTLVFVGLGTFGYRRRDIAV